MFSLTKETNVTAKSHSEPPKLQMLLLLLEMLPVSLTVLTPTKVRPMLNSEPLQINWSNTNNTLIWSNKSDVLNKKTIAELLLFIMMQLELLKILLISLTIYSKVDHSPNLPINQLKCSNMLFLSERLVPMLLFWLPLPRWVLFKLLMKLMLLDLLVFWKHFKIFSQILTQLGLMKTTNHSNFITIKRIDLQVILLVLKSLKLHLRNKLLN